MDQKVLIILISILVLILLLSIVKVVFSIIWWIIIPILLIGAGIIVLFTFLFHKDKKSEGYSTKGNSRKRKLNIYDEPLEVCQPNEYHRKSSAMEDGTCSEEGGGVHQICVKSIGKGDSFSERTGQSEWSKSRGDKNHCACLGAWANFVAKGRNDKKLKCKSIPKTALDLKYIKNWKNWNNQTVPNQIKKGLEILYNQCSKQGSKKGKEYFKKKYNEILRNI